MQFQNVISLPRMFLFIFMKQRVNFKKPAASKGKEQRKGQGESERERIRGKDSFVLETLPVANTIVTLWTSQYHFQLISQKMRPREVK